MTLTDIAVDINWTDKKSLYLKPRSSEFQLLCDYLELYNIEQQQAELDRLISFKKVLDLGDQEEIDDYVMEHYHGYWMGDDGMYLHLAGATDLGPGLRYDPKTGATYLQHANLADWNFSIALNDIITLQQQMMNLYDVLYFNE